MIIARSAEDNFEIAQRAENRRRKTGDGKQETENMRRKTQTENYRDQHKANLYYTDP